MLKYSNYSNNNNISYSWLNSVQDELVNVIESENIVLDSSNKTQLEQAIKNKLKRKTDLTELSTKFSNDKNEVLQIIDNTYKKVSTKNKTIKELIQNIINQDLIQNVNSIRKNAESSLRKIENETNAIINKFNNGILNTLIEQQNKLKNENKIKFNEEISQQLELFKDMEVSGTFSLPVDSTDKNYRTYSGRFYTIDRSSSSSYAALTTLAKFSNIHVEIYTDFILDTSELINDAVVNIHFTYRKKALDVNEKTLVSTGEVLILKDKIVNNEIKITKKIELLLLDKTETNDISLMMSSALYEKIESGNRKYYNDNQKISIKSINYKIKIKNITLNND